MREMSEYFRDALQTLRANKERYAEAESRARQQRPSRPVYYDVAEGGVA